jgi:predicted phosphodiesterase
MPKNYFKFITLFVFLLQLPFEVFPVSPFKFAVFSDLHISTANSQTSSDLKAAVNEVNALSDVDFVLVLGDVTQLGDSLSFLEAKQLLMNLQAPYYVTAGNHDFSWNSVGSSSFVSIFGASNFSFIHNNVKFISITSAPVEKYKLGHFQSCDISWLKKDLKKNRKVPLFFITHYPLLSGDVDNGTEIEKLFSNVQLQAILSGHYHRNVCLNCNGIPGIVLRSTLRGKDEVGGYSILSVSDSLRIFEKKINSPEQLWLTLALRIKKNKTGKNKITD